MTSRTGTRDRVGAAMADLRYVVRRLMRRPVYVASVVGVLALGMGGSIAVFGLVDVLLLRPLDVPRPEQLITFQRETQVRGVVQHRVTMNWFQADVLRAISGLDDTAIATTADDALGKRVMVEHRDGSSGAEGVSVQFVTWNYLRVMGIKPALGRDLRPDDDAIGAQPVAILGRQYWRESLGGDAAVVGRHIRVNGVDTLVVGILTGRFVGTALGESMPAMILPIHAAPVIGRGLLSASVVDVQVPIPGGGLAPSPVRPADLFQVIARVPPQGRARVRAEATARLHSDQWTVVPLAETMLPFDARADLERFLRVLSLAVGLTLALGCVNAGVLVRGDTEEREHEFAVRAVLGAKVRQVARLVMLEVTILSVIAGMSAAAVCVGIRTALGSLALPGAVAVSSVPLDVWRTVLFTVVVALMVMVAVSSASLLWVRRATAMNARTMTASATRRRLFWGLSVFQAATCVALTVAAVFFVRVVSDSLHADLGFEPTRLWQAAIELPAQDRNINALSSISPLLADIRRIPGIRAATIGPVALLNSSDRTGAHFHVDGQPVVVPEPIDVIYAADDYFDTLGQAMPRGRDFNATDTAQSAAVAIVNQAAARMLWGSVDPLGHHLMVDSLVRPKPGYENVKGSCRAVNGDDATPICSVPMYVIPFDVVGVVPTVVWRQLGESARPIVYLSLSQFSAAAAGSVMWRGTVFVAIRSDLSPDATSRLVAEQARPRGQSLSSLTSVTDVRDAMLRPQKLARMLLLFLAVAAIAIMLTGTYAAAHSAAVRSQRANAIRMALGATPASIVRGTVSRTAGTLAVGAGIGTVSLWWLGPLLQRFALGVPALDAPLSTLAVLAITAVGLLAAYIPSRRVYRTDPAALLRE